MVGYETAFVPVPSSPTLMKVRIEDKVALAKGLVLQNITTNSAVAFSGGKDSTVLLDIVRSIDPTTPAVFLDHGFHFPETLEFAESIPDVMMIRAEGELKQLDPIACCAYIKLELLKMAEALFKTMFVGIRRDEHEARAEEVYIHNYPGGPIRVYPILDFTESDIWEYLLQHKVKINPLYDKGYRSLGCTNCSEPYSDTERGGRGSKEEVMDKLRALGYF